MADIPVIGPAVTSYVTKSETAQIADLSSSIDAFGKVLKRGSHTEIEGQANQILSVLKVILNSAYKENFKNARFYEKWEDYLQPVQNLTSLLETYLSPTLIDSRPTIARLNQALTPVRDMICGEVDSQQGLAAKTGTVAAQKFLEVIKNAFSGGPAPIEPEVASHPLIQLMQLIGTFKSNKNDYLPISRRNQLNAILRQLDQKTETFQGIEAFVKDSNFLESDLMDKVTEFILLKADLTDGRIHELFYDHATRSGLINHWISRTPTTWCKGYFQGLAGFNEAKRLNSIQHLWISAAEHDEVKETDKLAEAIRGEPTNATQLSQKIDASIEYLKKLDPEQGPTAVTNALSAVAAGWLTLTYTLLSNELESSKLKQLESRLDHRMVQLNQGKYLKVLKELKEELQNSPLAKTMYASDDAISPIKTIQQMLEKQELTPSPLDQEAICDWDSEMEVEKENLVDLVGYLSTFKTVYNAFGESATEVDPIKFQRQSDHAYTRIMHKVADAPEGTKHNVFRAELRHEMNIRKSADIGYFRKLLTRPLTYIVEHAVRFFVRHFVRTFLDALINTVSLPARQPLSTVHLNPIRRINDSFVAQKFALTKWAKDEDGEEFGAVGKTKALEIALRDPKLNHNYEHDELVKKSTTCAVEKFLQVEGFSSKVAQWQTNMANWNGMKYVLSYPLSPMASILHGGLKVFESLSTKFLQFAAKKVLFGFDIPNVVLDSMKSSLYTQTQYTNSIDQVLLEQLLEVEKLLDQEGGSPSEHEGQETKDLFSEVVANAFRVIDLDMHLTAEDLRDALRSKDNTLSALTGTVKSAKDKPLQEALVSLLIVVYQSILTEDKMKELLFKILQSTNGALFPQTPIQLYYTESEKERYGRSDEVLYQIFADETGKKPEEITERDIEQRMKVKFNRTEQDLRDITYRIIKKSVHNTVQETGEATLMSSHQSVINHIDWMERRLLVNGSASSKNFFSIAKIALKTPDDLKALDYLQKETESLFREYAGKQRQLDLKAIGGPPRTAAHMRRINEIANKSLIPGFMDFQQKLLLYFKSSDRENHLAALKISMNTLQSSIDRHHAELERIKAEELRLLSHDGSTLSEKTQQTIQTGVEQIAPLVLNQVEVVANKRLNDVAGGAFRLYKNANTYETFLRHMMLYFVEYQGHKKTKPLQSRSWFPLF